MLRTCSSFNIGGWNLCQYVTCLGFCKTWQQQCFSTVEALSDITIIFKRWTQRRFLARYTMHAFKQNVFYTNVHYTMVFFFKFLTLTMYCHLRNVNVIWINSRIISIPGKLCVLPLFIRWNCYKHGIIG